MRDPVTGRFLPSIASTNPGPGLATGSDREGDTPPAPPLTDVDFAVASAWQGLTALGEGYEPDTVEREYLASMGAFERAVSSGDLVAATNAAGRLQAATQHVCAAAIARMARFPEES